MLRHFHASLCIVLSEVRFPIMCLRMSSFRLADTFQESFHVEINFKLSPIFKSYEM